MDGSNFRLPPGQWALLRRLLDEALDLPPSARDVWLAALPTEHAVLTARLRALLSHADSPISHDRLLHTLPKVETGDFVCDASRIGEVLGWRASVSLTDGLRRTVDCYRSLLS